MMAAAVLTAFVALSLTSCGGDDDDPVTPEPEPEPEKTETTVTYSISFVGYENAEKTEKIYNDNIGEKAKAAGVTATFNSQLVSVTESQATAFEKVLTTINSNPGDLTTLFDAEDEVIYVTLKIYKGETTYLDYSYLSTLPISELVGTFTATGTDGKEYALTITSDKNAEGKYKATFNAAGTDIPGYLDHFYKRSFAFKSDETHTATMGEEDARYVVTMTFDDDSTTTGIMGYYYYEGDSTSATYGLQDAKFTKKQ